ncbi:hypothetical protein C9009_26355 (plasmid) [Escherichia coli]|nr:hypothetical protein C9009_26355 [Escherichia coli]
MSPRALSRIHRNGKSILGGPVDWDMNPLRQCSQRCSCYAYSLTNRTPIHFPSRSFVSKREYLSSPLIIAVTTRIPLNAHIFRSIYTHYQSPVTVPARPLPQRGVLHTDYRLLVVPAVYVVKPDAYLLVASKICTSSQR